MALIYYLRDDVVSTRSNCNGFLCKFKFNRMALIMKCSQFKDDLQLCQPNVCQETVVNIVNMYVCI